MQQEQGIKPAVEKYLKLSIRKLELEQELEEIKTSLERTKWELRRLLSRNEAVLVTVNNQQYSCLAPDIYNDEPIIVPVWIVE
jgi:hypothetical protein